MTGKVLNADKNFKTGNKLNSNMVKISLSKSILSYQNGSAPNSENRECTTEEGMPEEGSADDSSPSEDPFTEAQNLKSECLDLLRKKLISDLSLTVFSCDLENKLTKIEPIEISKERQSVIQKLVVQISQLSDPEKLLLYLKLPSSTSSPFDPLRQPLNPLGNRQEIQQTIVWIKTHLEEDSEISIPKQDVYDQYLKYCENVSMKPLSTADFGKVMKQVYPGVRPRRLGTRGNSRYCYSGMRNTCKLPTPILPRSSSENPISNCCASGVSPFLVGDANKVKKPDKAKRKLSSFGATKKSSCPFPVKRSKTQKDAEPVKSEEGKNNVESEEIKSEGVHLSNLKCENCSENSFSAFDIECQLGDEKVEEGTDVNNEMAKGKSKGNQANGLNSYGKEESGLKGNSNEAAAETGTTANQMTTRNGDQTMKSTNHISQRMNDFEENKVTSLKRQKGSKGKTRKSDGSSFKQTNKNFKKSSYVPIQPKPTETTKLSVRFESTQTTPIEGRKETEGVVLCEESDSQEPEEEIVRYFKHLDESEMTATNTLVEQAVKHIDSNSVQISNISQLMTDSRNQVPYGSADGGEVLNQQIIRSRSCFDDNGRNGFSMGEKQESVYLPRSQSSVELLTGKDPTRSEVVDSDSGSEGKKNKISHLRILLEKSITSSEKNPYSRWGFGEQVTAADSQNFIVNPAGQVVPNESNFLLSNVKTVNGLKVANKGPTFVPQSPNTRTKYFSFTPISAGPQSPLKTPSASPFVSPRNTPVSRSRQNSYNDHFLSPSERKPGLSAENFFNFNKNMSGRSQGARGKSCKSPNYHQGPRPRSYSSTNFYRSKSRRKPSAKTELPKPSELNRESHPVIKNQVQSLAQNTYSLNSPFSVRAVGSHFVGGETLAGEVQKNLENNTKTAESQVATLRSRSVPLNRMIRDSSWVSTPVYSAGYFNSGNGSDPSKMAEIVTGADGRSPQVIPASSISDFVDANDGMGALGGEIFTGDPSMVTLNDQYVSGDFQRSNEEPFTESQPFNGEDSTFSNKLDLNSSGTFDSAFASDSDAALTENIKSYLPDFGGLDNKNLVEGSGGSSEVQIEGKLFKSSLYEGGNDNVKDPVITSFKPVLINEMSSSPGSPVLNFFGGKMNEDSQQLIEFFDFDD